MRCKRVTLCYSNINNKPKDEKMTNQIANEILNQLGNNKFIAMTGAKNFVASSDSLSFSIGRNKTRCNRVVITLTPADVYTVEFWFVSVKTGKVSELAKVSGVYNDMLRAVFTEQTGLNTSLAR